MRQLGFARALRDCGAVTAALMFIAQPGRAQEAMPPAAGPKAAASLAGEYVHSQMELVAAIRLNEDGTFLYALTVGSLDESARGRWEATGNHIRLTSDPRPVAPTIAAGRIDTAPGQPFAIRVLAPNGRDVLGVDLKIEFDTGEPLISYLAGGPWSLPDDEKRTPRFVTFSMPYYRLHSERLPLDARTGKVATFALTPNDFGVADLTGVQAEIHGETLTLRRPEGVMQFKRRGD